MQTRTGGPWTWETNAVPPHQAGVRFWVKLELRRISAWVGLLGSCSLVSGADYGHLYGDCASILIYSPVVVEVWGAGK
jgi:hypothetical protein